MADAGAEPAPDAAFAAALERAFRAGPPAAIGLAVSGGSDSMALLHLAADWAGRAGLGRGVALSVVTVDHGLRPEAQDEAGLVGYAARRLGLGHETLRWNWDRHGNVQDAARRARYRLLADWARERGLDGVLLGHTRNDQAETLLMRLARGSGVDGLAAMAPERLAHGQRFLRPLLDVERYALRRYLNARGGRWADDPTNDDPGFDRVRTRRALAELDLDQERLAETAARMADAREALEQMTRHVAAPHLALDGGDLTFPQDAFAAAPAEIRHRLLAHLLRWRTRSPYRPRYRALRALAEGLVRGRGGTLHGCFVSVRRGTIRIAREYAAVSGLSSPPDVLWDGFWRLEAGPGAARADRVEALGEAAHRPLAEAGAPIPGGPGGPAGLDPEPSVGRPLARPAGGAPRESLMASPALWAGDRLVAAPLAGWDAGWRCQPAFTAEDCLAALLSH